MKNSLTTILFAFVISWGFAQPVIIWEEDFSGYAPGATSGNGWSSTLNGDCNSPAKRNSACLAVYLEYRIQKEPVAAAMAARAVKPTMFGRQTKFPSVVVILPLNW